MNVVVIGQGKMGHMLKQIFEQNGHTVLGLADKLNPEALVDNVDKTDLVVDFSHKDNVPFVIETIKEKKIPYVLGTTALDQSDLEVLNDYATQAPVFFDANYSLGIALLKRLAAQAFDVLGKDFDVELVETHHNQKADAPSGTALAIVEAMDPGHERERVYGRHGITGARGSEIGIHALRGGTIAGIHEVDFFGNQEVISLKHEANDRSIFANGAHKAALFLEGQPAGLYSMNDLLKEVLG